MMDRRTREARRLIGAAELEHARSVIGACQFQMSGCMRLFLKPYNRTGACANPTCRRRARSVREYIRDRKQYTNYTEEEMRIFIAMQHRPVVPSDEGIFAFYRAHVAPCGFQRPGCRTYAFKWRRDRNWLPYAACGNPRCLKWSFRAHEKRRRRMG